MTAEPYRVRVGHGLPNTCITFDSSRGQSASIGAALAMQAKARAEAEQAARRSAELEQAGRASMIAELRAQGALRASYQPPAQPVAAPAPKPLLGMTAAEAAAYHVAVGPRAYAAQLRSEMATKRGAITPMHTDHVEARPLAETSSIGGAA